MVNYRKFRGAATVELAIFMPFIVLTLFIGVEVGRALQARTLLINGLHHSLLVGLHTLYSDKSLWGRNNNDEIVMDQTFLDGLVDDLPSYIGEQHELLSPASAYSCQCNPPPSDEVTNPTDGKVACNDPDIAACPEAATQVYLTLTSGINFRHVFEGVIPIGPLEAVIRIK